jgi:hypothetical protein
MLQPKYIDTYLQWVRSFLIVFFKLVFALGTAQEWKCEHAGFHYPAFYNFVVNYLEVPKDEMSQRDVNELLKWWNRYVHLVFQWSIMA